ncbi:MAG: molybdopterin molybdotransferase MoeA [Gammaproteobacteria bacterium]|nr:molybdopterin molybdotransferase MoeA [Gammaproteobacteria bacterium]
MNQQANCHSEFDPNSLSVDAALESIQSRITAIQGSESISISEAVGRVLAEPILSPMQIPAFTNSAMDGYAFRGSDLRKNSPTQLQIVGKVFAGHVFEGEVQAGECVRIMTGAKLPDHCDSVVMQEHVTLENNQIKIDDSHQSGQNVRYAGEEIEINSPVLNSGHCLTAADVGLCASLGIASVDVKPKVRVAFFSTGDELKSLGEPLSTGEIYDSNRYTLSALLLSPAISAINLGIIPDDKQAIETAFENAINQADLIITSGGVSVGEADFVKQTLDKLGEVGFWKISMKPGRPLAFGQLKNSFFFGLPGNPVSAMVTFLHFVKPAIAKLTGRTQTESQFLQVTTVSTLKKRPGRVDYQRGILFVNETGETVVKTTGQQGSHMLTSMSLANCFIVLPLESGNIEVGERVKVEPFCHLFS